MSVPARSGPLTGRRVLVARAAGQAAALSDRIRALGGEPVEAPALRIEPGDADALRQAAKELVWGHFTAVCVTSPNAVGPLGRALEEVGAGPTALRRTMVACVGPGTAEELARIGVTANLVPTVATTRALGEAMPPGRGRVLLPRADIASDVLPEVLRAKGYEPVEVVAYRTTRPSSLPPEVVADVREGRIDLLAFGSPSTARNLTTLLGPPPWPARVVSIGPVTTAVCHELGIEVAAEATAHDLDGLALALASAAGALPGGWTSPETDARLAVADQARARARPDRGAQLRATVALGLTAAALAAAWRLFGPGGAGQDS